LGHGRGSRQKSYCHSRTECSQEEKQESEVKKEVEEQGEVVSESTAKPMPRLSFSEEVTFELTISENKVITEGFWNPTAQAPR
jgi:hypothetical protein